jgi:tetratricopeptide (TPR) repeat protein
MNRWAGVSLIAVLLVVGIATADTTARDFFDRGIGYHDLGEYDRALEAYEQGLALEPDNALLWGAKGRTLLSQKRYAEAAAAYNRSLQLDPSQEYAGEGERHALAALTTVTTIANTTTATTRATAPPWWASVLILACVAVFAIRYR